MISSAMPPSTQPETEHSNRGGSKPLGGNGAPAAGAWPGPAAVRGNDWRSVDMAPASAFRPRLGVSVIVTYFEAQPELTRTLAALEGQTYPRDLLEVIVVDDGSRAPPVLPTQSGLDVRLVHQESRGFEAARARNNGARAARHGILVFLDGDMIADSGMVEAHARWHHAVSDALTLGLRTFVDAEGIDAAAVRRYSGALANLFGSRPSDPDSREPRFRLTDDLAAAGDAPFRVMYGCNFAVHKAFYFAVGGSDETFVRYGHEDVEFAYRIYVHGGLLIPVREAHSWHQGRWASHRGAKERALLRHAGKTAQLIAHSLFRRPAPGTVFAVPEHVVTIPAGETPAQPLAECVDGILADPEYDLVVRIDTRLRGTGAEFLHERFGANPRVRIVSGGSALDDFPASPFHLEVPPARLPPRLVQRMRMGIGGAAVVTAMLDCGARVTITRSWALRRAGRAGGTPADYGTARQITLRQGHGAALGSALAGRLHAWASRERAAAAPFVRVFKHTALSAYQMVHRVRRRLRRSQ